MQRFWSYLGLNLGRHAGIVSIVGLVLTIGLGLGITKLSMSPRSLPAARAALAGHTLAECERLVAVALDTDDAAEARAAVLEESSGS